MQKEVQAHISFIHVKTISCTKKIKLDHIKQQNHSRKKKGGSRTKYRRAVSAHGRKQTVRVILNQGIKQWQIEI